MPPLINRHIEVAPRLLGAIAEVALPEDDRRALTMVKFDRHEICACNGHIAVRYRFERPVEATDFQAFGISRSHVEAIVAANKHSTRIQIAPTPAFLHQLAAGLASTKLSRADEGCAAIEVTGTRQSAPTRVRMSVPGLDTSEYPPLDVITPKPTEEGRPPDGLGFNARYLELMYRVSEAAGFSSSVRVVAWGGLRDATLFESGLALGPACLQFIVMPIAVSEDAEPFVKAIMRSLHSV